VKAAEITTSIRQLLPTVAREILSYLPAPDASGIADITILFTDIDGYTSMTERLGDRASQAMLRAHNHVVRQALAGHGGREVKHTGDGIMAFFSCAARAVECALAIQDGITTFNHRRRDRELLRVAVGLNTGSPIREDGDLYGTAVIVAARAVDLAAGGEVVVTDVVRQLAAGKGLSFEPLPSADLEGLTDVPALYLASRPESVEGASSDDAL
jgi:class 3 adenylate cyclase